MAMSETIRGGVTGMRWRLPPAPWRDRAGRLVPLKLVVFVLLFVPAALHINALLTTVVAQPVTATIHLTGRWALYLTLISLAVTPLRQTLGWPGLLAVRRMLGVAAFAYAAGHLAGFVVDKSFDLVKVGTEIVLRTYLTIGFAALAILAALAATSTDAMIKRLGSARWQALHRAVYAAAGLAIVHQFLQTKADLWWPTLIAGLAGWLLLYRLVLWTGGMARAGHPATLAGIGAIAAFGTAIGESLYLVLKFNAPWAAMVAMQIDLEPPGPRPAAVVAAAALLIVVAALVRRPALKGRGRPASR